MVIKLIIIITIFISDRTVHSGHLYVAHIQLQPGQVSRQIELWGWWVMLIKFIESSLSMMGFPLPIIFFDNVHGLCCLLGFRSSACVYSRRHRHWLLWRGSVINCHRDQRRGINFICVPHRKKKPPLQLQWMTWYGARCFLYTDQSSDALALVEWIPNWSPFYSTLVVIKSLNN